MSVSFGLNAGGNKLPAKKKPHQNPSFLSLQNNVISQKKNTVAQRILSARVHKIKELKNEIFDLQQKLRTSNLENQVLKQLQWRHLKAISGYENSERVLPDLIARHCSEVRALRQHLRMSQKEERSTSRKLRKVEAELLKTKDALQALHMLSEDEALAEREELYHKLSVLTEKMEVNTKRIQSLEKQLKLNNSTFSRQLAEESKKAVEAGIITKNLQMEISTLHQKIKEKDRQLYVKNIYANRMPKIPKDRGDSAPHEKNAPLTDSVKEYSQEQDAVEEYEKEKKLDEQLSNSGKAGSKFVSPGPRKKSPTRLKKQYMFSEATENLHHGIPTSGAKPRKCSHCNHRHARQDCSEGLDSKVKNPFGLYEPSFGKATKTRQRDSSAEAEGCAHKTFAERKKSLMKELFGPSCCPTPHKNTQIILIFSKYIKISFLLKHTAL
uniref:Lebercilin-like protein n=1 Tax=Anas zonorhyncha TaxID=75864 RepID=A0A8B9ZXK0_9AVES